MAVPGSAVESSVTVIFSPDVFNMCTNIVFSCCICSASVTFYYISVSSVLSVYFKTFGIVYIIKVETVAAVSCPSGNCIGLNLMECSQESSYLRRRKHC